MAVKVRPLKAHRKLGLFPRIYVRARKIRVVGPSLLPPITPEPGLNIPETRIKRALEELKVNFTTQSSILGGDILGGGRADFLIHDWMVDLEYAGPFHATEKGAARDVLRNIGFQWLGYRVETLHEPDLYRIKPAILEKLGRRL